MTRPTACHDVQAHLDRWAGDGGALADLPGVLAHLEGCAGCRRYLSVRAAPARALRASGPTPVPEGLAERAFRAAMAGPGEAPVFLDRFVPVAARAALMAAVLALLVWGGVAALASLGPSSTAVSASDPLEVAVALATEGNGGP